MVTNGFIANDDLIQEDSRVEDLLDFSDSIFDFKKKIESISKPAVVGLVGQFGSGKSTMLYQIQKEYKDQEKWINFDAWKYPGRKDLWEGFVLDFADQVGEKKKVQKKIDGKSAKSQMINIATDVLSAVTDKLPDFNFLDKFVEIFKASPAKRVFEIQNILTELISMQKKNIYVTIEDIDRSGDAGVYFLETLKQFLKNLNTDKKIVVIVPMGDENYHRNLESYLKSIDYFEFFQPKFNGLEKFVNEIFDSKLFEGENRREADQKIIWTGTNRRGQIISFLEALFENEQKMTIRLLKLILRKANIIYKSQIADNQEPDFRVTICIEASKYFYHNEKESYKTYFDNFKNNKIVSSGTVYSSFLTSMLWNKDSVFKMDYNGRGEKKKFLCESHDFKFIERPDNNKINYPSFPWQFGNFADEKGFGITEFYLNY